MEMVPTLLGTVAGANASDGDVLTGSVCGNNACDACTDYAKATDDLEYRDRASTEVSEE